MAYINKTTQLLYESNSKGNNAIIHPTYGYMKWLKIYSNRNEDGNGIEIIAIYGNKNDISYQITSKKLSKYIDPKSFSTLLHGLKQISNPKIFALALLSLLHEEYNTRSIGVQTTIFVVRKRKTDIDCPDAESSKKVCPLETINIENKESPVNIINDETIKPRIVKVVKIANFDNEKKQILNEKANNAILQFIKSQNLVKPKLQVNNDSKSPEEAITNNMASQNLHKGEVKYKVTITDTIRKSQKPNKNPGVIPKKVLQTTTNSTQTDNHERICVVQNENSKKNSSQIVKDKYQIGTQADNSKQYPNKSYPNNINKNSINTQNDNSATNPNTIEHNAKNNNFDSALNDVLNAEDFTFIVIFDGTKILLPTTPQDIFHIATPTNLQYIPEEEGKRLILHQAFIDWKYCLKTNEDGLAVIHLAVLNDDTDLLQRHISVLKAKKVSIDVMAQGLTPLHIAIKKNDFNCTKILLKQGADPLLCGKDLRNSLHLAALSSKEVLKAVIKAIDDLLASEPNEETKLAKKQEIFETTDAFGYNAFMLACKNYIPSNHHHLPSFYPGCSSHPGPENPNIRIIYKNCPTILDYQMPSTGNTVLHNIMSEFSANINNNNPSPLAQQQLRNICNLLKLGANITIRNNYGLSFNHMLQKCRNVKLQMFLNNVKATRSYTNQHLYRFWATLSVFLSNGDSTEKPVPWTEYRKTLNDLNITNIQEDLTLSNEIHMQLSTQSYNDSASETNNILPSIVTNNSKALSFNADSLKVISGNLKGSNLKETAKNNVLRTMDESYVTFLENNSVLRNQFHVDTVESNLSHVDTIERNLSNVDTDKGNLSNVDTNKRKLSHVDDTNLDVSQVKTKPLSVTSIQSGPKVDLSAIYLSVCNDMKNNQPNIVNYDNPITKFKKADLTDVNQVTADTIKQSNLDTNRSKLSHVDTNKGKLSNVDTNKGKLSNVDTNEGKLTNAATFECNQLYVDTNKSKLSHVDTIERNLSNVGTDKGKQSNVDNINLSNVKTIERKPSNVDTNKRKLSLVDDTNLDVSQVKTKPLIVTSIKSGPKSTCQHYIYQCPTLT